jgi:hypothetical protein
MFYDEDDEDELSEKAELLRRQVIEKSKKEFIEGCYDAYDMLVSKGKEAIAGADPKSIGTAINRMTALFLMREEYERCEFLKKYAKQHLPGFEIKPDGTVEKELSL